MLLRLDSTLAPGLDGHVTPDGQAVLQADVLVLAHESYDSAAGRAWLVFPGVAIPKYHRATAATLRLVAAETSLAPATVTVRAFAERDAQGVAGAEDLAGRPETRGVETVVPALTAGDVVTLDVTDAVNHLLERFPADSQPRGIGCVLDVAADTDVTLEFASGSQEVEADRPMLTLDLHSVLNLWRGDQPSTATEFRLQVMAAAAGALYEVELESGRVAYRATAEDDEAAIAAALAALLEPHGEVVYPAPHANPQLPGTAPDALVFTAPLSGRPFDFHVASAASLVEELQAGALPVPQIVDVVLDAATTGGTWTLTLEWDAGAETTSALPWNATAIAVAAAVNGLATPQAGDATVAKLNARTWRITLGGSLAGQSATATVNTDNLTIERARLERVQEAGPIAEASDLYLYEASLPHIFTNTESRRFRIDEGAWSEWQSFWTESAFESQLRSLFPAGVQSQVNVEILIGPVLGGHAHCVAVIKLPAGFGELQVEVQSGGSGVLAPLATASHAACYLIDCDGPMVPSGYDAEGEYTLDGWQVSPETPWSIGPIMISESDDGGLATALDGAIGAGSYTLPAWQLRLHPPGTFGYFVVLFDGDWAGTVVHADDPVIDSVSYDGQYEGTSALVAQGVPTVNQIDRLTLIADDGDFTLTIETDETDPIDYPTSPAAIDDAIEDAVGSDVALVTTAGTQQFLLEWVGDLAATAVDVSVDGSGLTGPGGSVNEHQAAAAGVNAIQRITVDPSAFGGTLRFQRLQSGWSLTIAWDADVADLQAAADALWGPARSDWSGVDDGGPWIVEFTGLFGAQPQPLLLLAQDELQTTTALLEVSILSDGTGPNNWADPRNWSLGRVPETHDVAVLADGAVDALYGIVQLSEFRVTPGSPLVQVDRRLALRPGMRVRIRTTGRMPETVAGPLDPTLDYIVWRVNRIRGEIQLLPPLPPGISVAQALASTETGLAFRLHFTAAGEGVHELAVALYQFHHRMEFRGALGLPPRDEGGSVESLPRFLRIGFLPSEQPQCLLGIAEGSGSRRLQIDCGRFPAHVEALNGGSGQGVQPPIQLLSLSDEFALTNLGATVGLAVYPGERSRFRALHLYGGSTRLGRDVAAVPGALIDRLASAELVCEECSLQGATLRLRS